MRSAVPPSETLAAHLRPIAALALLLVGAVAPLSWFAQGVDEQRALARQLAAQVGELVRREAIGQPRLWRYDTQKLADRMEDLRRDAGGLSIRLGDGRGLALVVPPQSHRAPGAPWALWARQPLASPAEGKVWVAMDLRPLWRRSLAMAGVFGALGLALAGLMVWLPLRAVRRSEAEIGELLAALRQSRSELAELASSLEARVQDRSARLEQALADLRDHERHLRELAAQALRLQESERRAIARDLHDDIGQVLTGVRLQIQLMAGGFSAPAAAVAGQPNQPSTTSIQPSTSTQPSAQHPLLGALDSAIEQTRLAVRRLAPPLLAEQGLASALRQTCSALTSPLGPRILCDIQELPPLDSAAETAAFRIAQEALTNAVRHAAAREVRVEAGLCPGAGPEPEPLALWVEVSDDGRGFDLSQPTSGQGLRGMRDRAELLGGRLELTTAPGKGCAIRAVLPSALHHAAAAEAVP